MPCVCTLYKILYNLLVVSPQYCISSVFLSTGPVRLLHVNEPVFQFIKFCESWIPSHIWSWLRANQFFFFFVLLSNSTIYCRQLLSKYLLNSIFLPLVGLVSTWQECQFPPSICNYLALFYYYLYFSPHFVCVHARVFVNCIELEGILEIVQFKFV